jgi:hypothetical protein
MLRHPVYHRQLRPRLKQGVTLMCLLVGGTLGCDAARSSAESSDDVGDHIEKQLGQTSQRVPGEVISDWGTLQHPTALRTIAGKLIVLVNGDSVAMRVIDGASGQLVGAIGRTNGVDSAVFQNAWSLNTLDPATGRSASDHVWMYNLPLRALYRIDVANAMTSPTWRPKHAIQLQSTVTTFAPAWLGDGTIMANGDFPKGRFATFDTTGHLVALHGESPPGVNAPNDVRQHAYQGILVANPGTRQFVLFGRYSDRMEFYNAEGKLLSSPSRPFEFEPQYDARPGRLGRLLFAMRQDMRFGYVDVAATPNRIYALFSGRMLRTSGQHASSGRYVLIYDWHGHRLKTIKLGVDATALTVDGDSTLFTADAVGPDTRVYRYQLRALALARKDP